MITSFLICFSFCCREEPPECESPESEVEEGSTPVANVPRKKMAPWGSPTLRIRDMQGNILEVNSDKPVPYESEYFVGTILTMVRCEGGRWQKHFEGKQRKFEVQIQVNASFHRLVIFFPCIIICILYRVK